MGEGMLINKKDSTNIYMNELRNMLNSTYRGYYCPSFFKMEINTKEDLSDLKSLDTQIISTFFHEYIHSLQDITTTFGLTNACIIVDRMKYYNNDVILNKQDFKVPYSLSETYLTQTNYYPKQDQII